MKGFLLIIMHILAISALLNSCQKENAQPGMKVRIQSAQAYDSVTLAKKLVGSWQWTMHASALSNEAVKADEDVKVTFTKSGNYKVRMNSSVIAEGAWQLRIVNADVILMVDSPSPYLYGRIILRDDEVLFNNSFVDGCDNLFVRIAG